MRSAEGAAWEDWAATWLRWIGLGLAGLWGLWALAAVMLVGLRWMNPPTTAVQVERRVQAWIHGTPYPLVSSGPIRFIDITLCVATEVGPRKARISRRPISVYEKVGESSAEGGMEWEPS